MFGRRKGVLSVLLLIYMYMYSLVEIIPKIWVAKNLGPIGLILSPETVSNLQISKFILFQKCVLPSIWV